MNMNGADTTRVFVFTETLRGWRRVHVREHRTAVDRAQEVQGARLVA